MSINRKKIAQKLIVTAALYMLAFGAGGILPVGFSGVLTATVKAESNVYEDFEYNVVNSDKVVITGYIGNDTEITIPQTVNGMSVEGIGAYAFEMGDFTDIILPDSITYIEEFAFSLCEKLTSIDIPDSVSTIGNNAFRNCSELVTVTLPDSLIAIENQTFMGCYKLTEIVIPSLVTDIGNYAFSNCYELKSIELPNGLKSIGEYAFQGCRNLIDVVFPNNLETIGRHAFHGCFALTQVTIPAGVSEIKEAPFSVCSALLEITVEAGNENYVSNNGVLYSKDKSILIQYPAGKTADEFTVPVSVTQIGEGSFNSVDIKKIVIGINVQTINTFWTFSYSKIEEFAVNGDSIYFTVSDGVLFDKSMETLVAYPLKKGVKQYTIPDGVKKISESAFNASELTDVVIPDGVVVIDDGAFFAATNLNMLIFPDSVTTLGAQCFDFSPSLTAVVLPASVQEIGNCYGLPAELAIYGEYDSVAEQFATKHNCEFIHISQFEQPPIDPPSDNFTYSLTSDNKIAISKYIGSDTIVEIPETIDGITVAKISSLAFADCADITEITIPSTVIFIDALAFENCVGLTSIHIPAGVTHLNEQAFLGCSNLKAITVDDDNLNYSADGSALFNKDKTNIICYLPGNTALSYNFPSTIISVGSGAFKSNKTLKTVVLSDNIEIISQNAFNGSAIESIIFPDSLKTIEQSAFAYMNNLESIYIPKNVSSISYSYRLEWSAFRGCVNLKTIEVAEDNEYYCAVDNVLFTKDMKTLVCYPAGKPDAIYNIPSNVVAINPHAFEKSKPTEIVLPQGITEIGERALTSLQISSITIPNGVTTIGANAFWACSKLESIIIPASVEFIDESAFSGNNFTIYGIPNSYAETFANENDIPFINIEPAIMYGDVDGSDGVNDKDVTTLKRYLANWHPEFFNRENADVNADGLVNDADVIILKRFLSESWVVELG